MLFAIVTVDLNNTFKGKSYRFCSTCCKDQLIRRGANQAGNLLPGQVHCIFCCPSVSVMSAGGISETFGKIRKHDIQHPGVSGCGGIRSEESRVGKECVGTSRSRW